MANTPEEPSLHLLAPTGAEISLPAVPVRAIGVDLGTTNSTVAEIVWEPGSGKPIGPRCLEVDQDTRNGVYTHVLVPSAVAVHEGRILIGEGARRLHARAPELGLDLARNLFLECKNEIGTRRTYHRAPEGLRSPAAIAGHLLGFLRDAAMDSDPRSIDRTVVTVPASFQAAQRVDTARAAELAGFELTGGDLLDEPVAAFLDYLLGHPDEMKDLITGGKNLLVFDFGGGTCDVAVLRITHQPREVGPSISPLAVSRYHRLGGGDIDRAILHEVLIPQLLKQNDLGPHDLTYEDKRNAVEPALLGVAESLKIELCREIVRLRRFGWLKAKAASKAMSEQPGMHVFRVGDRELKLQSPRLTVGEFNSLLEPFLDRDLLYARETEYRLTCSVFAPLQDALDRCRLEPGSIDLCVLVGGSSLIPQVEDALKSFLPKAKLLKHDDPDATQTAVARGAAYHALALALFGRSIFHLVAQERIAIRTAGGSYELVSRGAPIPFPSADSWVNTTDLMVPETLMMAPIDLRVELLGGDEGWERVLFSAVWSVRPPVNRGDRLRLRCRMDENQILELQLALVDDPGAPPFETRIENPITNVVNPNAIRDRIQKNEEDIRIGSVPSEQVPDKVVEIARDYADIDQYEKAISCLKRVLRMKGGPDGQVLNLLGVYSGERKDWKQEEKYFQETAKVLPNASAPLFNLALSQKRQKRYAEAYLTACQAIERGPNGPEHTLAAQLSDQLNIMYAPKLHLDDAMKTFGNVSTMSDWELGWYLTACRMTESPERLDDVVTEQTRRRDAKNGDSVERAGVLPELAPVLTNA